MQVASPAAVTLIAVTAAPPSSLRERKKRRTRQALIDTALELFTRRGFGGVTLDELCEEVEVSKRTFFRTFTSKEDVAMAPDQDLWRAFLEELETVDPGGRPLVELGRDALLAALERMDDEGWTRRLLLSRRLAERTPSMGAHGLQFCEATTLEALEILDRRFGLGAPGDLRPRLAVDMLIAAFRGAVAGWAAQADGAVGEAGVAGVGDAAGVAGVGVADVAGVAAVADVAGVAGVGLAGVADVAGVADRVEPPPRQDLAVRIRVQPPSRQDLAVRLRAAVAALPGSLALTTGPAADDEPAVS
ncbi:hypothetical protein TPA0910_23100 [Streptomyces hygroscopicus subsp. sporocinereus]|uniref:HTH tetR-type domain-containing protein n=1 Tax=Streptomyces hygroscopicus TaxID=1912 RepID=A0ABQ3TX22_STRHY|nr:hypothetical protein TPA0910_23100 [Streptomyces hygroscopicus]